MSGSKHAILTTVHVCTNIRRIGIAIKRLVQVDVHLLSIPVSVHRVDFDTGVLQRRHNLECGKKLRVRAAARTFKRHIMCYVNG